LSETIDLLIPKGIRYIDEQRIVEKAIAILETVGNLRLKGETGTGKTTLVYYLAQKLKLPLFETVLTVDTSRWDLLATDILEKGNTQVRKGLVVQWLEAQKGIKYIDGFNYGQPNIISLVEPLADFRGSVYIAELNKTYKRTDKHYLIISYNPNKISYAGTFMENIATIRRFEGLEIGYLSIEKETEYIQDITNNYEWSRKMVEIANKTRKLYLNGELKIPLTTGNLVNYAKLYKYGLSDSDILEIASSLYDEEQKEIFKRQCEELES